MSQRCPCCSGKNYAECCGRFHNGAEPETCEQVMRARYCAFVKGEAPFLIRTSHPTGTGETAAPRLSGVLCLVV